MSNNHAEPKGTLATMIRRKMDEGNVSINDLRKAVGITYEHARRIVNGEGRPSKLVLNELAKFLGIPTEEAQRLSSQDKLNDKFGDVVATLTGRNPQMAPIEAKWDMLTDSQRVAVITMVDSLAKSNGKTSKSLR